MSDDLEKRLSGLRPEGDPKFQQQLEDRLLAQIAQRKQRKMNANGHLKHTPLPPQVIDLSQSRPVNLTLVATITIFLLIGVALAALMQQRNNDPSGAFQNPTLLPTETATPVPAVVTRVPTIVPMDNFTATPIPMDGSMPTVVPPDLAWTATPAPNFMPSLVPTIVPPFPGEQPPFPVTMIPVDDTLLPVIPQEEWVTAPFYFDGIPLLDYTVEIAGGRLILQQTLGTFEQPYRQFIHIQDAEGQLVATHDFTSHARIPGLWGRRQEEVVVMDVTNLAPGDYEVSMGMYNVISTERVPIVDNAGNFLEGNFAPLGTITISDVCTQDQQPVVMTTQDIARGTTLSAAMITLTCWNPAPAEVYSQPDQVIGQILQADVRAWSPVLITHLGGDFGSPVVELLDREQVAMAIPLAADTFYHLRVGDRIDLDIVVTVLDVETRERCESELDQATCDDILGTTEDTGTPVFFPVAEQVEVLLVGQVPEEMMEAFTESGVGMLTVSVDPQTATVLSWAIEAQAEIVISLNPPQE